MGLLIIGVLLSVARHFHVKHAPLIAFVGTVVAFGHTLQAVAQSASSAAKDSSRFTVAGTVRSPGGITLDSMVVELAALGDSNAVLWHAVSTTDSAGRYSLSYVAANSEWPRHFRLSLPHQRGGNRQDAYDSSTNLWNGEVARRTQAVRFDVRVGHSTASYWYGFFLLLPAVGGSLIAMLHLYRFGSSIEKGITLAYVLGGVLFWSCVNLRLAAQFGTHGTREVLLFTPDLSIPISVPIFAYLGVFVYATYSLLEKYQPFFKEAIPNEVSRREILLAVGNRVYAAPYLAIVTVMVIFRQEKSILIPFVAFFTGLWIEIIVGALSEIGARFTSLRSTQTSSSAPPP